jgi:serine/threonine protein kinase
MARVTAGRVPVPVTTMIGELAGLVDRARYDRDRATPADAGLAWAFADEILARMPRGRSVRIAPVRHPRRALRRLALTRGQPRRRDRWTGVVPPSAAVLETTTVPEIPGYAIEARIGVGATSAVYRAHHRTTGEAAAVKVFTIDVSAGRDIDHQRFVWEARVAEMVSGRPNLPVVLGSGFAANGQPYLVTKLYTNGTLASRVRIGGPLDADQVASAGRELALALAALHENGVLHGDVKPENVFIADDGTMVLGDLGGAWVPNGRGRTASLTPAYAAPEVWLGHAPTTASDLYSLGLTLLYAATGTPPHPGAPPGVDEIVAAFGADTALRLLEIDPRRRFRSAAALATYFGADLADRAPGGKDGPLRLPPPSWTIRG